MNELFKEIKQSYPQNQQVQNATTLAEMREAVNGIWFGIMRERYTPENDRAMCAAKGYYDRLTILIEAADRLPAPVLAAPA